MKRSVSKGLSGPMEGTGVASWFRWNPFYFQLLHQDRRRACNRRVLRACGAACFEDKSGITNGMGNFHKKTCSRRAFLKAGLSLTVVIPFRLHAAGSDSTGAAELAHQEIWNRFVDKRFNVLLHYAGLKGELHLPTAEECQECKPNGMSWSTPIEDGPFFGGIYLVGLCLRREQRMDAESKEKARRIAAGLMKLAEAGKTPGFVARGFGADGQAHYPASSEDQVFPWFLGLWSYLRSGMASPAERTKYVAVMLKVVRALESHDWQVPCDRPEFGYRGAYNRATSKDCVRLLFLLRATHELTGDPYWLKEYQAKLTERVGKGNKSREELCAEGFEYVTAHGATYVWTTSMCQAALRGLRDLETEPRIKKRFQAGLDLSAERVTVFLAQGLRYERTNTLHFDPDWRFLNMSWKPQHTCDEAIALAKTQLPLWAERNPRSPYEDETMREPLFAAWIITLSGNKKLIKPHRDAINSLLRRYDWQGLYTAAFFVAVNVHYQLMKEGLEA